MHSFLASFLVKCTNPGLWLQSRQYAASLMINNYNWHQKLFCYQKKPHSNMLSKVRVLTFIRSSSHSTSWWFYASGGLSFKSSNSLIGSIFFCASWPALELEVPVCYPVCRGCKARFPSRGFHDIESSLHDDNQLIHWKPGDISSITYSSMETLVLPILLSQKLKRF